MRSRSCCCLLAPLLAELLTRCVCLDRETQIARRELGHPKDKAEGEACSEACATGLECKCLALNRGLYVCQIPGMLDPPPHVLALERQGLTCEPRLPKGAQPIPPPPLVSTGGKVIDPAAAEQVQELREWVAGPGKGFYSQYVLVHHPDDVLLGIPVLAGPDVSLQVVERAAATLKHLLLEAAVSTSTLESLSHAGVRLLLAKAEGGEDREEEDGWLAHPEVSHHFATGLGGGSPLFPSTGIRASATQAILAEEMFHTIQYAALKPRDICMYRKAYKAAMERQLYTTDNSGPEVDGEPVPTVQADEYLAMAMQRWFGNDAAEEEYKVPANTAHQTGRESLRQQDPKAFCLISTVWRADDSWNPDPDEVPWKTFSNRGMDMSEVASFCAPVLQELASGCPNQDLAWPSTRPRIIP